MFYETTFLISSEVDPASIADFWENLIKKIEEQGLLIEKSVKPHSRVLAYPIKKIRRAYVATMYIHPPKEAADKTQGAKIDISKKIKEMFSGDAEVLRTILLSVASLPQPRTTTRRIMQPIGEQTRLKTPPKKSSGETIGMAKEQSKQEKPLVSRASFEQEIDKKLDEILEDKIGF